MSHQVKLLPCPFCGSEKPEIVPSRVTGAYTISCNGPSICLCFAMEEFLPIDEVVRRWNIRSTVPMTQKQFMSKKP